jgi:putative hemolysin
MLLAIVAAAAAALFAAADGALLSLEPSDATLEPRLVALRDRHERTHRALAFARVCAHLAAGAGLAWALDLGSRPRLEAIALALPVALVAVLLSESVARSAGDALGSRGAARLLPFIVLADRALSPVVVLGTAVERALHAILPPAPRDEEDREATAEQFRQIVADEAEMSRDEETLLHGVFSLGNTEVHEVMVPRVDVVAIDEDAPWSEMVDRLRSAGHARLPVFKDTVDNIVGVLYAKDLLPAVIADEEPASGWQSLIRPGTFIPATKPIDALLREFQSTRTHIAIVVDEYGGTAGVVTIEDVLEEIVGEIRDEYDEEESPVEQEDGRRYWVSGRVTLDELSELLGHDFAREDVSTVGGLMYELLGRVPRAGEELNLGGFRVVVERVRRRRVERVYFERIESLTGHAR